MKILKHNFYFASADEESALITLFDNTEGGDEARIVLGDTFKNVFHSLTRKCVLFPKMSTTKIRPEESVKDYIERCRIQDLSQAAFSLSQFVLFPHPTNKTEGIIRCRLQIVSRGPKGLIDQIKSDLLTGRSKFNATFMVLPDNGRPVQLLRYDYGLTDRIHLKDLEEPVDLKTIRSFTKIS